MSDKPKQVREPVVTVLDDVWKLHLDGGRYFSMPGKDLAHLSAQRSLPMADDTNRNIATLVRVWRERHGTRAPIAIDREEHAV